MNAYRKISDLLEQYLIGKGISDYTQSLGLEFLHTCKKYRGKKEEGKRSQSDNAKTFIDALNSVLYFNCLHMTKNAVKHECPLCFDEILDEYTRHLSRKCYKSTTITTHRRIITDLLIQLSPKISDIRKITPDIFVDTIKYFYGKEYTLSIISTFMKFVYAAGYTSVDMSLLLKLPKRDIKIPTTYSKDDITLLFSVIDRKTVIGKRDYAMILLAYRLGLRTSDICALTFQNIDFQHDTISLTQLKTGNDLNLPLLPEIKEALLDYLSIRPNNTVPEIFLRVKAPYTRLTRTVITTELTKYWMAAGVDIENKKHGSHSLRSTLASELVSEKVPYAVAGKILGHNDSSSIKYYVKLDIEQLRECAMPVPPPSGKFLNLLKDRKD